MHAPEFFLSTQLSVTEWPSSLATRRAAQPGRAWLSGGASVLTEPNVKSPSSVQQDSHDGRRPLLPENSMTNGSGAVLEPCLPLVLACVSGGDALVGGAAERQI